MIIIRLQVGERVAFVIIKGAKGAKAHEKAEDPIYALEHNLPIDAQHYLEHHLSQPLLRIFEPILGEKKAKSLLSGALYGSCSLVLRFTPFLHVELQSV